MKQLMSLEDFQKENLNVMPKAQMAAVFGGDPTNYSYNTLSSANLSDTEKQTWRDNCNGNARELISCICTDVKQNVLELGTYKTV